MCSLVQSQVPEQTLLIFYAVVSQWVSLPSFSFLLFALYFPCLILSSSLLLSQFMNVPSLVNPLYNVEERLRVFRAFDFSLEDFCSMVWKANALLIQDVEAIRSRLEWVLFVSAHSYMLNL